MLLLPALLAWAAARAVAAPTSSPKPQLKGIIKGQRKLTFDAAGNFKVVSFSDMHFGERPGDGSWAAWGPEHIMQDAATQKVHGAVLDHEKPDYVVFNGDIITGENVFAFNATGYLDQAYAPTVARKIPFSVAHGNHDNANNINHQIEIEYEQATYSELSYTRSDVGPKPYGSGNYWVPVYAHRKAVVPALIMWFFDSRAFVSGTGNGPGPVPDAANYYWVDPETVPAYMKEQRELMSKTWGKVPPALIFVHIPVQKAQPLASLPSAGDHDDEPNPSAQGFLNNTYTGLDLPFWNEIIALSNQPAGNVLAVTSGHDHGESWCARSLNISASIPICFNGHSGYGGYVTKNSALRNGRVFALNLRDLGVTSDGAAKIPVVKTWNSYEDGTTAEEVVLGPDYMKEFN
ncbi:Metallo-dependent phosphatase-like protein [Mycena indigotica]|uniref:Metallo-dependent phosphatase-like protein n=1 Tax=Mycena indigotica TaxID=2126181 RepID=A0A8H6S2I2_9AGAR|nr:Metallo-dependent phosphatase-like protein [Mycena indigotica]KAF7291247.1 Metallo-dependent phosphatase-like protein [Mycena indigotica]